ncbi:alpha/beta hydrolase family protein [Oceanivirga salmonicida]|uniref:alpha/beta hydrolase family protein n=1 Tax=Oceanivirga salmonicida TaxID=1769291 RepID=UPI00082AA3E1|nr:alpha/beta hydrolase [Oceanivirga salmonicida]
MKKLLFFIMIIFGMLTFSKKRVENIEINNGFYKIPAIYTYDDEIKNMPLVIMLHGTASNKDEVDGTYIKLSNKLYEKGISSIRFDFIGTGDSKVDYLHYTISSAVSDTNRVIEFARSRTNNNIGLLGWSQGGTIALLAGANKELSSISTWAGSLDIYKNFYKMHEEAKKNGFAIMKFEWREPLRISLQWFNETKDLDMIGYIRKIKVPIMALAGTKDDVVNPKQATVIVKNSNNKKSKVVLIKDSNHIFNIFTNNSKVDEGIEKTTDWFVETLK